MCKKHFNNVVNNLFCFIEYYFYIRGDSTVKGKTVAEIKFKRFRVEQDKNYLSDIDKVVTKYTGKKKSRNIIKNRTEMLFQSYFFSH